MEQYNIYQQMSQNVYKLKENNDFINEKENDPLTLLHDIPDTDGSTWKAEKVYSASENTGSGNVHTSDGYAGAIYRNSLTNEVIVVNAGTEPGIPDIANDAQMALGNVPLQYSSARQMMQDAIALSGGNTSKISVGGHSLGGSLAQLLAVEFGVPAVTFNAYGVNDILQLDSNGNPILQMGEYLQNTFNQSLFPDLFAAYHSGVNESQIINYKMSGDVVGNAGKDVGITVIVGGEGNILTTIIGTVTLTMSDIIVFRDPLAVMNLGHLLAQHGITEFANFDPMKFDFDSLMQGGGIPQSIIPNYTPTQYDPITLDLDGDGIETVGLSAGVLFDHNGDGIQTGTGWVGKDDGLLVLDKNNNGTIDNGAELFGDNTLLRNGQKAKDGFAAISDLDLNQDGKLNSSDAAFANLRVWQDANQDGFSQASELKTLNELGISSINTISSITGGQNQNNGNVIIGSSSFMQSDGTIKTSGALNFTGNTFTREFSDVIDTSAVAGLPDMRASGTVRDLREAAALSPDLAAKLQTYAESNTRNSAGLDALLSSWAATSDMQTLASTLKPGAHPAGGRGTNLNQDEINKLKILEKFTGLYGAISNFSDPMDKYDGVTNGRYSGTFYGINLNPEVINASYALLSKSVDSAITVQTDLKDEMNEVMFKFSPDGVTLDMSNVYAKATGDNASKTLSDVINLYNYFKDTAGELFSANSQLATFNWIKDQFLEGKAYVSDYVSSSNGLLTSIGNDVVDINSNAFNMVTSSGGNDKITIHGNSQNVIVATGGDMTIQFADWEDNGVAELNESYIQTGTGSDIIKTSLGSDTIKAGAGDDLIIDAGGNNIIYGEDGNDTISIGATSERIESHSQVNQNIIYGGAGNDSISGARYQMNSLYGGDGDDSIRSGDRWDILEGGSGDDFISVESGDKTYVFGRESGHDVIVGSFDGNDVARFTDGIRLSDISFNRKGLDSSFMADTGDWTITIKSSDNTVELWTSGWHGVGDKNTPSLIEIFEFDDGTKLDVTELFRQNNFAISASKNSDMIMMSQIVTNKIAALEGDDVIIDDTAKDTTYVFGIGGGKDVIEESGGVDAIAFGSGITTASLNFTQDGNDLIINLVDNSNDQITITQWYSDQNQRIEKFIINEEVLDANKFIDFKLNTANILDIEQTLLGNNEADSLIGNEINHKFIGGRGNDFLQGSFGADKYIYNRGDGEDVISDVGGNDKIIFGAGISQSDLSLRKNGNDFIVVIAGNDLGSLTFKDWYHDGRVNGYIEQFQLADGSILNLNELQVSDIGTNNNGSIWGWNGQDQLIGGEGDDSIVSYAGNDDLYGNNGNDFLDGGADDDLLYSGEGNDSLIGGMGNDMLYGGDDNDLIRDYFGSNKLYGGAGDDILSGALSDNGDNNYMIDEKVTNFFAGGTGNDILNGYGNSDIFSYDVGDGDDVIANFSGSNENIITLGNGILQKDIDYIINDTGLLLKIGGQTPGSININGWGTDPGYSSLFGCLRFADGSSFSLPELFHNSTYVSDGTSSNDYIMGQERNNIIIGDQGNDRFYGAKYNDTYVFNRGDGKDEIINDQGGNDTLQFNGVSISELYTYRSGDHLIVGYGNDRSDEVKIGWYYSKTPFIQIERISIDGELYSVNNLVQLRQLTNYLSGSDGDDVIQGTEFKDNIYGFDGNDIIYGGISSDSLGGGSGDDILSGENGNDALWGGTGNDLLNGGLGNDYYQFAAGDGIDIIEDSGGADVIALDASVKIEDLEFNQVENDLILLNTTTADQIIIKNWAAAADNQIESLILNETSLSLAQLVDDFNRVKTGTIGDDNMLLTKNITQVNARAGNDTLVDQTLNNTNYIFNLGDGQDSIRDSASVADQISFGAGISAEQLRFSQSGNDLIISLNSQDQITIRDYALQDSRIENLNFADGSQINLATTLSQHGILNDAINPKLTNNDDIIWASTGGTYALREGNNQLVISNSGLSNTVSAGAGNDRVLIMGDSTNKLSLGAGDNVIEFHGNGNNTLTTGVGNDVIHAGNGDNIIRAGDGDNTIILGAGTQNIVTGSGNDQIDLSSGNITLNSGAGDDIVNILNLQTLQQATINLGDGNDQLNVAGTDGLVKVTAGLGADNLQLIGVNTQISDAGGNNLVNIDNHELMTVANNVVQLGAGDDVVNLSSDGTSSLSLGDGNNQLEIIGNGINSVSAGADNDHVFIVGDSVNKINLGAGDNLIDIQGNTSNTITTGVGNDVIHVQNGDNIIRAGDGDNLITLGVGTQNIVTGSGNDKIELSSGNVTLNSGAGNDEVTLNQTVASINTLNLGIGDDVLTLNGAGGNSIINGSTGNDNFNIQNSAVKLSDSGGDNRLYIDNSAMIGDINTINLGLGNDQVTMLSNGQTTLKTSNGDNLLNLSGTGTFNVSSGTGSDQISSGSGNDILNSGAGADILNANAGNDHLIAGAGNDTLIGGTGDDLLEGGSDNDSYQFNAGDGKDLIKDSSGIDQAAFGNGVAKDDLWFMRSGKDLVVNNTKTQDEIKVNNWFASKSNQLESFSLASGEVLSGQAVASLIQAMAAFNPQPMAETMMTSAQQTQFQDLLKNTWVDPTK